MLNFNERRSKDQKHAREVILELIDSGLTIQEIGRKVGISSVLLADFIRGAGDDLTSQEVKRLIDSLGDRLNKKIYNEGLKSNAEDNPYSYALDIRSFCLFAAGVNDK